MQVKKTKNNFLYFFLFCFAIFLFAGFNINAAVNFGTSTPSSNAVNVTATSTDGNNNVIVKMADVSIWYLQLTKTDYQAGETVRGTFVLHNNTKNSVSDVRYRVFLMGDYVSNGPQTKYDYSVMYGPFSLSPDEDKTVDFTYKIPTSINGKNFGIQVRAMDSNGTSMGWNDAMINVSGGSGILTIKSSNISVNKNNFILQEGPTIYKDQKATLNFTFQNTTNNKITTTPFVNIYKRPEPDKILSSFYAKTISIEPGSQAQVSIDLPTFNYSPQIYVGDVSFLGTNTTLEAPKKEFRYIIGGDVATINHVSSDQSNVAQGQTFNVAIDYSGSPQDIMTGNMPGSGNYDFNIKIYNQNNKIVGNYSDKTDFNSGYLKTISFKAIRNALALRAEITVLKDGKTLASYKADLSSNYKQEAGKLDVRNFINLKTAILVLAIILIIIGIIFRKKLQKNKLLFAIVAIILLVLIGTFLFMSVAKGNASGSYNTTCTSGGQPAPSSVCETYKKADHCGANDGVVTVTFDLVPINGSFPGNSNTLYCGEKTSIHVTEHAAECGNIKRKFCVSVVVDNVGSYNSCSQNSIGDHENDFSQTQSFTVANNTPNTAYEMFFNSHYTGTTNAVGGWTCDLVNDWAASYSFNCPPPTCGTAIGTTSTAPTANLCVNGNSSTVTGSAGNWSWDCSNDIGTVHCPGATTPGADGNCGTANGQTFPAGTATVPNTTNSVCFSPSTLTTGWPTFVTDTTTWKCSGSDVVCKAYRATSSTAGKCGSANGRTFAGGVTFPDGYTFCDVGGCNGNDGSCKASLLGPNNGDTASWQCIGTASRANCSAARGAGSGTCSTTRWQCNSGTVGATATYPDSYQWWCNGNQSPVNVPGPGNILCSELIPNPGVCSSPPTHYNCSSGTLGLFAEYPWGWQWYCNGTGGSSVTDTCTEYKPCIDSNVRVYNGGEIKIGGRPEAEVISSLKIKQADGSIWGLCLVDISDACSSGVIIKTESGQKALKKYPCP